MRQLALVSLLVFTVTFSTGCALSRSGSKIAALLRRDAATSLKQMTERSAGTPSEKETSSELVQASFTKEADGDAAAFSIETDEEPQHPEWWTATKTVPENQSFEKTTLSANSMTNVTASPQTDSWKPTRGWAATKSRSEK